MGEENTTPVVEEKGSVSTSVFWYDEFKSEGVFGSIENSSVMVTADTAFEDGRDVSGPYGSTGLGGGIMSGAGAFGGSWIAIAWAFFLGLSRIAEAKLPNMEDGFVG